ncbi:MAG: hypothetical protein EXS48_00500 [Candidatus Staskawiczbacteria bacterium]|nr:hypothetical protein [Candidatus Staskawiczbacteria bacterium]
MNGKSLDFIGGRYGGDMTMYFDFFKKYIYKKKKFEKTNIYFHNFRSTKFPENFDMISLALSGTAVKDVFKIIRETLKIHPSSPMQAYAVKNINNMHYSWLYDMDRNGYGPKSNFKSL